MIGWALSAKTITFAEYDAIVSSEKDWWVRKCAFRELTADLFGAATYADFVNCQMRDAESEVARIAAGRLIDDNLRLTRPYGDVETTAKHSLKAARIIRSVGQPSSRINEILGMSMYDFTMHAGEIPELTAEMNDLDNKINIILKTAETTHQTARKFINEKV